MGDRMERLAILPFRFGCASQSSVEVKNTKIPKSKISEITRSDEQFVSVFPMNNPSAGSLSQLSLPKATLSVGLLQRLMKGLRSLSQLFVEKEKEYVEMQIGLPTDVKHIGHIGWNGSTTTMKSWNELRSPQLPSMPSMQEFEFAMAAQAAGHRQISF